MASAELRDELNCSICLNLYTDPVSLRCGHNFCRSCIIQVLDTQDGSGGYSCPDCRAEYPERPPLQKRRKLSNIVEHFLSTQPNMEEETRIFCTYCTKSPVPAVKSCLHCEISLCDDHLTAHNKTVDHILTEPSSFFGNKKCSIHNKVLEYYCAHDEACLCVSCCLVGNHRGHQVKLLDEASKKKKKQLRKHLENLNLKKANILSKRQNLHDDQKNIQEKASAKRENVIKLFMDIRKQLEMAEKKALSEISRQEEKIVSGISDLIKKLEIEENKLSKRVLNLEEMCHITDPIRFLQESNSVCGNRGSGGTGKDGGKVKSQNDSNVQVSDIKVHDIKPDPGSLLQKPGEAAAPSDKSMVVNNAPVGDLPKKADNVDKTMKDLDEVLISLTIHRSMRDIITNVTSQLWFHVPDILLDEDTAHEYVQLSEDLKTAKEAFFKQKRKLPGTFRRYPQVLSRCGLSSGRRYWEVEWNQRGACIIGMSYPSIKKAGEESFIGDNGQSWSLDLEDYSVSHNMYTENLDLEQTCPTLGVFLDYEAGRLSFYELCDPIRHLHTFTASFTEPLHAIFHVNDGGILKITT